MTKHKFTILLSTNRQLLIKLRSIKLRIFISKLQEFNTYLGEFFPGTSGQETVPFSTDEIMDFIYNSMPIEWNNKMIEQNFTYVESTAKEKIDFF